MLTDEDLFLAETPLADWQDHLISSLIARKGWRDLPPTERIAAIHDFVRNDIRFGYNRADDIPASEVLTGGYGQCNTKSTLMLALLRGSGLRCRLHGFTIAKALQRGIVPELVWPLTPADILHSWVEVELGGNWVELEGFILDEPVLAALRRAFPGQDRICGYGAATSSFSNPPVTFTGGPTAIQSEGINQDFGTFDSPDAFYARHRQAFGAVQGLFYRLVVRHWMNRRVESIRRGQVPAIPAQETESAR